MEICGATFYSTKYRCDTSVMAESLSKPLELQYICKRARTNPRSQTGTSLQPHLNLTHRVKHTHIHAWLPTRLGTQSACGWSQCWVKLIPQLNYRLWASVRGLDLTFSKCQPVAAPLAGFSVCICPCARACGECAASERVRDQRLVAASVTLKMSVWVWDLLCSTSQPAYLCACVCMCVSVWTQRQNERETV